MHKNPPAGEKTKRSTRSVEGTNCNYVPYADRLEKIDMHNQIIVDYIAFTLRNDSLTELVGDAKELHTILERFCEKYCNPLNEYIGGHMYTHGYISSSGFRTYYGGEHVGNTLFVQISGAGCVQLDQHFKGGLQAFLQLLNRYNVKMKRLDLAADEIGTETESDEYCLSIDRVVGHLDAGLATGSARSFTALGAKTIATGKRKSGATVYIGNRKSDVFMRIYDKFSEQKLQGSGHWMRCELELHGDAAQKAFKCLVDTSDGYRERITELYRGLCLGLVRFIKERKSNVTRSETVDWWTDFLGGCTVGIRFTQEKEHKTLNSLMDWVDHSVLGALNVIYNTYGFPYLIRLMNSFVAAGRLSAAHRNMIVEFEREAARMRGEDLECYDCVEPISSGTGAQEQFTGNVEVL